MQRFSLLYSPLSIIFFAVLVPILSGCDASPSVDPTDAPDLTALVSPSSVQTRMVGGVRSTTVTWPDEMSVVAYPTQLMPSADCHITKMVYRTIKLPNVTEAKGLVAGQEQLYMYTSSGLVTQKWAGASGEYHTLFIERTVTFRYDASGRLIEEVTRHWDQAYDDTISYRHEPDRILYANSHWNGKRIVQRDTLTLNAKGLSRRQPTLYQYGYYDKDGFLAVGDSREYDPQPRRLRQRVSNGNVMELTDSLDYWGETRFQYLHYVDRPNVPNKTPFYGQQSRQLLAQELWSLRLSPFYRDGDKYMTRYMYLFDVQGRVRRSIAYGRQLDPSWPFELYTGGIRLIDYSYSCP